MYRIDTVGNNNGQFVEEDLSTDTTGTAVSNDWLNALQAELVTIILSSGQTLDKNNSQQIASYLITQQALTITNLFNQLALLAQLTTNNIQAL